MQRWLTDVAGRGRALLSSPSDARFGAFQGVFRPVALTIMGAMLYLREGWLVGNSGLLGALVVLLGAYTITGTTALSLSSIATNVRVRPGGAFAIVSQALGVEAGGAIGVPLYIAQAASISMYLFAFSEAWAFLFPTHDTRLVVLGGFVVVGGVAMASAGLALRAQGLLMGVVVLALLSALGGVFTVDTLHAPTWMPDKGLKEVSWLGAFALFFPAATGIMVGAGMSGSLKKPREDIPRGTLWAWGVTLGLYVVFAVWYAVVAGPQELMTNKLVIVDRALWGPLVLAGLLSSTLLAALSSQWRPPGCSRPWPGTRSFLVTRAWLERTAGTSPGTPRW